jgi:hypothetical protein
LQNQLAELVTLNDQPRLTKLCQQIEAAKTKVEGLYHRWQELEEAL